MYYLFKGINALKSKWESFKYNEYQRKSKNTRKIFIPDRFQMFDNEWSSIEREINMIQLECLHVLDTKELYKF